MAKITQGQGPTDKTSDVPVEEQIERNIADPNVSTKTREQDREHVVETEEFEDGSSRTHVFEEEQFDPSEHTVPEVNEYLASVEDNESEYNRVWDAEVAGQNRKGIVGEA
jgi:hypothetical protein